MSIEKEKDKFVKLINPAGEEEDAWDFANHIDELLSKGWTRPGESPRTVKGNPGPELITETKTEETE